MRIAAKKVGEEKKEGEKEKEKEIDRKKEGRSGKRMKAEEGRGGEGKSLPQDSRDVVGIISTFAWMRVLLPPPRSTPFFPDPPLVTGSFFHGVNSAYRMAVATVVP